MIKYDRISSFNKVVIHKRNNLKIFWCISKVFLRIHRIQKPSHIGKCKLKIPVAETSSHDITDNSFGPYHLFYVTCNFCRFLSRLMLDRWVVVMSRFITIENNESSRAIINLYLGPLSREEQQSRNTNNLEVLLTHIITLEPDMRNVCFS